MPATEAQARTLPPGDEVERAEGDQDPDVRRVRARRQQRRGVADERERAETDEGHEERSRGRGADAGKEVRDAEAAPEEQHDHEQEEPHDRERVARRRWQRTRIEHQRVGGPGAAAPVPEQRDQLLDQLDLEHVAARRRGRLDGHRDVGGLAGAERRRQLRPLLAARGRGSVAPALGHAHRTAAGHPIGVQQVGPGAGAAVDDGHGDLPHVADAPRGGDLDVPPFDLVPAVGRGRAGAAAGAAARQQGKRETEDSRPGSDSREGAAWVSPGAY